MLFINEKQFNLTIASLFPSNKNAYIHYLNTKSLNFCIENADFLQISLNSSTKEEELLDKSSIVEEVNVTKPVNETLNLCVKEISGYLLKEASDDHMIVTANEWIDAHSKNLTTVASEYSLHHLLKEGKDELIVKVDIPVKEGTTFFASFDALVSDTLILFHHTK